MRIRDVLDGLVTQRYSVLEQTLGNAGKGPPMTTSSWHDHAGQIGLCVALALAIQSPSPAEEIRLPVTRDTWVSNVGKEATCNLGGAPKLKVKSIQEMSLLDLDPSPLRGRVIEKAELRIRIAGKERLWRMTLSSIAAEWTEGTSPRYAEETGSSTHNARMHPDVPWAYPDSDLCSVILAQGNTVWGMADATPPDKKGWQKIAVAPKVIAARGAGLSRGFLLFDDTGSEWTRDGEKLTVRHFPNRFLHSRNGKADSSPYFVVHLGARDAVPPASVTDLRATPDNTGDSIATVRWRTPADRGPAGTAGFAVAANGKAVPRYLIPLAGSPGSGVTMHLRDLPLPRGQRHTITVRAIDWAGNTGPSSETSFIAARRPVVRLPEASIVPFSGTADLPTLGNVVVYVLDALDKVHPETGKLIPTQSTSYLSANHLWSASGRRIRLQAARGETVMFQLVLRGSIRAVTPTIEWSSGEFRAIPEFYDLRTVPTPKGRLPDPAVPLNGEFTPDNADSGAEHHVRPILCEVTVPRNAPAGTQRGTLRLQTGTERLTIALDLHVWDFSLPDQLSFLPEMNCYGLPRNERDYYRMAHRHRTVLNRLPYSQNGTVKDGCAPTLRNGKWDWTAWDKRFGPLLDGSLFADLPRAGVPVDVFYLPLHENWPGAMSEHYNGDYWADRAFTPEYREAFVRASQSFARHIEGKGWHTTLFHCYLNNKINFKQRGWSRGSSPWLLDEPANFQDYWALRWFALAFHEGIAGQAPNVGLLFRGDVSRPQWERDSLEGLMDYYVVGGKAFRKYGRMVRDRQRDFGLIVVDYGSTNDLTASNMQPVGWCLDSWTLGSDGVLPWQTIGRANSWTKADRLSLFYPGETIGRTGPVASVRLKAYRRGQQDVEYLTIYSAVTKQPRRAVAEATRHALRLKGKAGGTGFRGGEDAGIISYTQLRPQDAWRLRVGIGQAISGIAPPSRPRWKDFRPSPRDISSISRRAYHVAP